MDFSTVLPALMRRLGITTLTPQIELTFSILVILLTGSALILPIICILRPETLWSGLFSAALLVGGTGLMVYWLRAGLLQRVNWSLLLILFSILFLTNLTTYPGLGPQAAAYTLVVTLSGLLLGRMGLVFFSLGTLGALALLVAVKIFGVFTPPSAAANVITEGVIYGSISLFTASLTVLVLRVQQQLLARSVQSEQTARAELEWRRATEDRLRYQATLLENVSDAIVATDRELRITHWNRRAEKLFGYTAAEALGQNFERLCRTENAPTGLYRTWQGHLRQQRKDGVVIDVETSSSLLKDATGQLLGSITISRDVTEKQRMQTALRESNDQLEQRVQERTAEFQLAEQQLQALNAELLRSNADLERFAYVAAHDLQEPLRQTTLYTQLLASRYRPQLDTEAQQAMDFIVEGATRMNTLVKGLLTYSQVGLGAHPFQPVDCTVAVQQAIAQLQDALIACGGTVTFEVLPTLFGDAPLLTQLFHNLISNAIKFRGAAALQVHLSATALEAVNGPPGWRFAVRDNGIGIAPQYFEQIFVIFHRVHARTDFPGTGIGLALCKRIVEQHAGRIWVESQLGQGATFFIELPATKPIDIRSTPPHGL